MICCDRTLSHFLSPQELGHIPVRFLHMCLTWQFVGIREYIMYCLCYGKWCKSNIWQLEDTASYNGCQFGSVQIRVCCFLSKWFAMHRRQIKKMYDKMYDKKRGPFPFLCPRHNSLSLFYFMALGDISVRLLFAVGKGFSLLLQMIWMDIDHTTRRINEDKWLPVIYPGLGNWILYNLAVIFEAFFSICIQLERLVQWGK